MKMTNKKEILRVAIFHTIDRSPAFQGSEGGYIDDNDPETCTTPDP